MLATSSLVAHAGPGASWQAIVTIICLGLALLFVAVVAGWFEVAQLDDLLLPTAAIVIVAGLGTGVSETVSDWVGWAIPIGVVAVGALLMHATTERKLGLRNPLTWGAVAVAAVAVILLVGPLTNALHPPEADSTATLTTEE